MAVAIARASHDQRLSVVEHLDELRSRLIISLIAVAAAFALCMWQNHALLRIVDKPLERATRAQARSGQGPLAGAYAAGQDERVLALQLQRVASALQQPGSGASANVRASLAPVAPALRSLLARAPPATHGARPVTLGIGEPFTVTVGIAFLFGLVLALPVVLYELYAFLLPALSPQAQRSAARLILPIPLLFAAGVVFGYVVVLPAAVHFFQNFNSGQFDVLVQAGQYYHFAAVTLLAMGLLFQTPVAILAATRGGVVTPRQLRANRRYALLACGLVAAFLPGDVITLVLETVPLYLLFEASLLLATIAERRAARRARAASGEGAYTGSRA